MTKRKAIETAMAALRSEAEMRSVRNEAGLVKYEGHPTPGSVENEIGKAYELGRIAGLREAASAANEPSDAVKYRQWANALAKKVRTKSEF